MYVPSSRSSIALAQFYLAHIDLSELSRKHLFMNRALGGKNPVVWRKDYGGTMKILVIGGTGKVGAEVVKELQKRKADIRLFVRKDGTPTPTGVEVAIGDLLIRPP